MGRERESGKGNKITEQPESGKMEVLRATKRDIEQSKNIFFFYVLKMNSHTPRVTVSLLKRHRIMAVGRGGNELFLCTLEPNRT